ncbi:MAG: oligosaccharide flippase family protein [Gammaproteobacteria bacterium]|nr:oligosaccharide flippase family protein [Gammaproteobacteria bacterium]
MTKPLANFSRTPTCHAGKYEGREHGSDPVPEGQGFVRDSWSSLLFRYRHWRRNYHAASWSLIDQSIVSLANFLSVLLLARFMAAAEFGGFVLAQTGLLLVTSLQTSLLTQSHNVLGAKLKGKCYRRFTGAVIVMQIVAGLGVCLLLALAGCGLFLSGARANGILWMTLAAAAFPWMAQEFVRRVLYTRSAARAAAMNDVICYGLQLIGVLLLVRYLSTSSLTAVAVLLVFGGSSLIAVLFGVYQLRDHVEFAWRVRFQRRLRASTARVWRFGGWLLAQNVTTWFGANGHAWVVGALLGTEVVGLYRAAIHLVNLINPLRQAAFVYLPARASLMFAANGYTGLACWVRHVGTRLLLLLAPLVLLLVVFPEQLLRLMYGGKFSGMGLGLILALAAAAQAISFARYPLEVAVLAAGEPRRLFHINLLSIALLLTCGIGLIVSFGIVGIALSMLLISIVLYIATAVIYRRVLHPAVRRS